MQVKNYTPQNNQKIKTLFLEIFNGFIEGRELAWRLFYRDIIASHRKSYLGLLWMFLPPLATTGVWIFLNNQKVVTIRATPMNYSAYVLCGTMLWSLFSEAINKPIQRYQAAMGMMSKLNFPRESIILASFYDLLYSLLLKLIVLIPILWILGYPPGINFIFAFFSVLGLMFLGISLGIILSPLGLLYNDIGRALPIILPFCMYLCPVIYPIQNHHQSFIIKILNPVTPFIERIRSLMGGYSFEMQTEFIIWLIIAFFIFIFGLFTIKISLPIIIERSGG